MVVDKSESIPVRSTDAIVRVRQEVRKWAVALGFSLVDQTKIITAASEIARNTIDYGGGGEVRLEHVRAGAHRGLRLVFTDQGPGIPDIARAMSDGYTSGSGLGLGLGGAKRLCNEFDIRSAPGEGTTISMVRWK